VRTLLAGLALAGVAACGRGVSQTAADTARGASGLTLEIGTRIKATTDRSISSRSNQAGDSFTASISRDVKDGRGRVVIPTGSTLNMTIAELQSATDRSKVGSITVLVNSVTIGEQTYPVTGGITSMVHTLKGRGVGEAEVAKTAAGVVIGGIAGRIIGGSTKGTMIGAVVGGAAGAAVAVETANRDVMVSAGTPMVVTLSGPVSIAAR
jgi:hypothetical protein